MVIINSPSNPSGAVVEREEFEKIYQLTSARGIYLMTDECYCQFLYDSEPFSIASLPGAKETVLVAGSLSKTYAMTGWRIGFGLVPPAIVQAMTKLQSHSTSNPCSISQKAAVEALRGPQESVGIMLAEYRKRRDFVVARLRAIPGVQCNEPQGAFYVYPNVSRGLRQERHRQHAAVRRAAAGGSPRGGGPGRSVRHRPPHSHLLRHVDEGTGARAGTHPPVHREELVGHGTADPPHTFPAREGVGPDASGAVVSGFSGRPSARPGS